MQLVFVVTAIDLPQSVGEGYATRNVGDRILVDLTEPRTIGRRSTIADISLPHPSVGSRRPFLLFARDGEVRLEDRSHNGRLVNGQRTPFGRESILRHGDVLTIPPFHLRVEFLAP